MAKVYSGDKIVVSGKEVGSLYPTNREEVYKEIVIDGLEVNFEIYGGVFSSNITIMGGGLIKGPVFSQGDISIFDNTKPVILQSGITALNSLLIEESGKSSIENRLSYSIENVSVIVRGDVISKKKVVLNDTIVIGSIIAPDITLKNCIVFGAIKESKQISLLNSIIGVYITERISFQGANGFFVTGGKSKEMPDFINEDNQPSVLRYIPLCRLQGYGCGFGKEINEDTNSNVIGLSCSYWVKNQCKYKENISIEKNDFVKLKMDDDYEWYLGLQGRALTLKKINEINKNFERILHGIFSYDHLSNEDKEYEVNLWNKLSKSEQKIFKKALGAK